jgi:hypothetical protein
MKGIKRGLRKRNSRKVRLKGILKVHRKGIPKTQSKILPTFPHTRADHLNYINRHALDQTCHGENPSQLPKRVTRTKWILQRTGTRCSRSLSKMLHKTLAEGHKSFQSLLLQTC